MSKTINELSIEADELLKMYANEIINNDYVLAYDDDESKIEACSKDYAKMHQLYIIFDDNTEIDEINDDDDFTEHFEDIITMLKWYVEYDKIEFQIQRKAREEQEEDIRNYYVAAHEKDLKEYKRLEESLIK